MSNVLQFPTSNARIAAQRIGATNAELDQVAASIEEIVCEIHRLIADENRKREQILKDWNNGR